MKRVVAGGLLLVSLVGAGCSPRAEPPGARPTSSGILGARPASPPGPVAPAASEEKALLQQARGLTRQGRFDEAEALLRGALGQHGSEQLQLELSGLLLEAGRPDDAIREIEPLLAKSPGRLILLEQMARATLFSESLHQPPRPEVLARIRTWLDEIHRQHREGAPLGVGTASLPLQWAWLAGRHEEARQMVRLLRSDPSLDPSEVADVLFMDADLALRAGDRARAGELLEEYLRLTKEEPSDDYVELYPVRYLAMWVAHAYLDRPLDREELRAYRTRLERLQERDLKVKFPGVAIAGSLERYADAGDARDKRRVVLDFADEFPPPHDSLCFFGEAVQMPAVKGALALRLGDLARETGDPDGARRHYEQGLRAHPGDRVLQSRLRELAGR